MSYYGIQYRMSYLYKLCRKAYGDEEVATAANIRVPKEDTTVRFLIGNYGKKSRRNN